MKYFLLLLFFIFSCSPSEPTIIKGCTVPSNCNYNADAMEDDGSCREIDNCDVCGGPNIDCSGGYNASTCADMDCAGICFGETSDVQCAECITNSGEFDCSGQCCVNDLLNNK